MPKDFILATAVLLGTIIGAGIFALPYAVQQSGILAVLFYCLFLGGVVLLLHLAFSEVVLRTKPKRRLAGYAEMYLGQKAKTAIGLATIAGTIGALLAYLILAGKFLTIISASGLSETHWALLFWAGCSVLVAFGIKSIAQVEVALGVGLFSVIFLIFGLSAPKINPSHFTLFSADYFFLPFGLLLFSLMGWSAVPEAAGLLKNKKQLKGVIILSVSTAAAICFLFGFILSGVSGPSTTTEPFEGLLPFLGPKIIFLGALFGLLSIASSFLVLGNYLKNVFYLDYRLPKSISFILASFLPLTLFLLGARDFIRVIALAGAFLGLVEGAAILLIFQRAKTRGSQTPAYTINLPRFLIYFIIAALALGALSQIIYHF